MDIRNGWIVDLMDGWTNTHLMDGQIDQCRLTDEVLFVY